MLEVFPNAVSTIINVLPSVVTEQVGDEILRIIAIVCIVASPIALSGRALSLFCGLGLGTALACAVFLWQLRTRI
jgi:hypothetical protein